MSTLRELLARKQVLVADGAWGTLLQAGGLEPGECPELWNVTHPEAVRSIAAGYVTAGSDLILTNTFGGSPLTLRRHGLEARTEELNAAGVGLSLEAARHAEVSVAAGGTEAVGASPPPPAEPRQPGMVLVAASLGPTGELIAPLGTCSAAELEEAFRRQVRALVKAGVRILCIETMISLEEAACAVRAARQAEQELGIALEVMATLTYGPAPGGFRTVMGASIPDTVAELERAGADVLGSNCGNGIEQMLPITLEFRRLTSRPLLIQANAGLPQLEGGRTVFRQGAQEMARWVPQLVAAGVSLIGGCCGTGPAHIAAIRRAVDAVPRS